MIRLNSLWLMVPLVSAVVLAAQPAQPQTVIYRSRTVITDDYDNHSSDHDYYYGDRYNRYPYHRRVYRYPSTRYPNTRYPNPVIRGDVEDSTLIRPTIINSTIEDSILVNPVISPPSRTISQPTPHQQSNPACMAFREIRIACQ
jgi:hypothetical protein